MRSVAFLWLQDAGTTWLLPVPGPDVAVVPVMLYRERELGLGGRISHMTVVKRVIEVMVDHDLFLPPLDRETAEVVARRDLLMVTAQPTPWKKSAFIPVGYETHVICVP